MEKYITKFNRVLSDMDFFNSEQDIKDLSDAMCFLDVVIRICRDDTNYINTEFPEGSDGQKLYIDGCVSYLNEKEKTIVKKFLMKIKE